MLSGGSSFRPFRPTSGRLVLSGRTGALRRGSCRTGVGTGSAARRYRRGGCGHLASLDSVAYRRPGGHRSLAGFLPGRAGALPLWRGHSSGRRHKPFSLRRLSGLPHRTGSRLSCRAGTVFRMLDGIFHCGALRMDLLPAGGSGLCLLCMGTLSSRCAGQSPCAHAGSCPCASPGRTLALSSIRSRIPRRSCG